MNTEDIKTFLINSDYPFIKVTQLTQLKTRRPLPFFLVDLVKNERAQKIYDCRQINRISITVEPYRGRNIAQQCFRCNQFHHNAANCQITPRCLKCNGSRQTNLCQIKEKIPLPTCINCGKAGHVASYRGCEKFPKRTTAQQNRTNYFQSNNRNFFNADQYRVRDNVSFANTVTSTL